MRVSPEFLRNLAEALSPLSHSLAAGILIRPIPQPPLKLSGGEELSAEGSDNPFDLCLDLDRMLKECAPAMREAMRDLCECGSGSQDQLEEIVDEMASPALDLVDMARRVWECPFPREAETARVMLATLAEAPVTQLLQWILEIMHTTIDPWSIADNPEHPDIGFELEIPDQPVREALARWRKRHPGILPEEVLRYGHK
ncbi:MAG: hypothetical protein LBU06_02675 [Desulfovibrio sp.]|jgi:hypothetical protein|nr:hypothetical protein [Desulfovibrio sp.]